MASIFGASKGIAPCCFACSSKSFSSTNKNPACGSTNRLISHGHATRSTLMSFRVIHFMFTSRSPRICEFDGEAIFVELWRIGSDQAGKALASRVDQIQVTVRALVPSQANICSCSLSFRSVHLEQRRKREKARKRVVGLETAEYHREV